jgi:hypothetical protein
MWTRTANETVKRVTTEVAASEIGCFSYCAKAWHLQYVAHVEPTRDATERQALGVNEHTRHGARVRHLTWLGRHAPLIIGGLLVCALLAAATAVFIS